MSAPTGRRRKDTLSRAMSQILRHSGTQVVAADGFVAVDDLLAQLRTLQRVTRDEPRLDLARIQEVVGACKKQRFQLQQREEAGRWYIRAVQGHSLAHVESSALLRELTRADLAEFPVLVHGTTRAAWASIRESGLSRMTRVHIHFAVGDQLHSVQSGFRASSQVLVYLDLPRAMAAGLRFYVSANHVVLTEGPVPVDLFLRVVDRDTGEQLQ